METVAWVVVPIGMRLPMGIVWRSLKIGPVRRKQLSSAAGANPAVEAEATEPALRERTSEW